MVNSVLIGSIRKKDLPALIEEIDSGADLNLGDENGDSPLHWAFYAGSMEIVELLVERGARISVVNKAGEQPIHQAALSAPLPLSTWSSSTWVPWRG